MSNDLEVIQTVITSVFPPPCSIGKSGTLTVRTDKQEDDVTEGNSPSTFTVLELNPATTSFYLGGVPDDVTVSAGCFLRLLLRSAVCSGTSVMLMWGRVRERVRCVIHQYIRLCIVKSKNWTEEQHSSTKRDKFFRFLSHLSSFLTV